MPKATPKNGYKRAKPLPAGEILEDVAKKKWKLGPSIGQGGFGDIYCAQEATASGNKYPNVIKIEPHGNGPLCVEINFYIKHAKSEEVDAFKKQKGLKTFGMPLYLGSGSHEYSSEKYRFIVMEKFGTDLWKIFLEHNRHFPATTVFKIAVQILDVLEYIHSKGYVHADIKAGNILMGATKDTMNKQVYLVDFGLATKCCDDKEFKPNPKKAHDGTVVYLSRDAHNGVQTKRGDLETLAYNLIQWLGCTLPWEKNLKDSNVVHKSKEEHMPSVFKFIKACFDKRSPPGPIVDFLNYLSTLSHNSNPDYKNIRKIFLSGVDTGDGLGKPFQFTMPERSPSKSPAKRKNAAAQKSSPKRKQAKTQIKEEKSEDEKENFEDDDPSESDDEEVKSAKKNVTTTKSNKELKGKKKATKKATKKKEENDVERDLKDAENDLGSGAEEVDENNKRDEDTTEVETKSKKKAPKKKKSTKAKKQTTEEDEENGVEKDEEPTPETSTRTTRQNGKQINYKEESDDEGKPSRKKNKNPVPSKEIHVTGDSLDGYTDATKQVANKKLHNDKSKKGWRQENQVKRRRRAQQD